MLPFPAVNAAFAADPSGVGLFPAAIALAVVAALVTALAISAGRRQDSAAERIASPDHRTTAAPAHTAACAHTAAPAPAPAHELTVPPPLEQTPTPAEPRA